MHTSAQHSTGRGGASVASLPGVCRLDVFWTTHAARRLLERKLDPADVLHALHVGLSRGMFRQPGKFTLGKVMVVAEINEGRLVVITVVVRKRRGLRRNRRAR